MNFLLNEDYVDEKNTIVLTIKFKEGVWASKEDEINFSSSSDEWAEDYDVIALTNQGEWLCEDEVQESIEWNCLTKKDDPKTAKIKEEILNFLQSGGYETEDLIVSSGRVYIGYDQCETYVQNSGAWLSSSMMC